MKRTPEERPHSATEARLLGGTAPKLHLWICLRDCQKTIHLEKPNGRHKLKKKKTVLYKGYASGSGIIPARGTSGFLSVGRTPRTKPLGQRRWWAFSCLRGRLNRPSTWCPTYLPSHRVTFPWLFSLHLWSKEILGTICWKTAIAPTMPTLKVGNRGRLTLCGDRCRCTHLAAANHKCTLFL